MADAAIAARIATKQERVHILTGPTCSNNCVFCMEEDREARFVTNSATTDEVVQWILRENAGCEEVCFTSGEPTVNPSLPKWVRWARDAGVPRISMMTNGRRLSYESYAKMLVAAGMNRFYVSIHGHEKKLHEGLTRTPDCFEQTVAGIDVIASLARYGVELHTTTVLTNRNLPHLWDIYRFLRGHGVQQVIFNVMQPNGRANTHFERIFPQYTEVAAEAKRFLERAYEDEARVMAFLIDIPLCVTEALPDFNRGYIESYVHYEPPVSAHDIELAKERDPSARTGPDGSLVQIRRSDLDDEVREKRAECAQCKYDRVCEGVWRNYLTRHGWDEFQPVSG